jgi:hypothetical protein
LVVALSIHGIERYTKDIDLALTLSDIGLVEPLLQSFDPRPLRIGGISFLTKAGIRVDLIDRRVSYQALFEEAISSAHQKGIEAKTASYTISVLSLSYLVALKVLADRPQDEADPSKILSRKDLDYTGARDIVFRHVGDYAARRLDRMARIAGRVDAPKDYSAEDS